MTAVQPLGRAWISTGGTGARNYDEFADESEITAIIDHQPLSALAVEMPHCAPSSVGKDFEQALPEAAQRLREAQQEGAYRVAEEVLGAYRISDPSTGATAYGVFAMVATDEISTSAAEPGLVIRNEDVFADKVRERVALIRGTQHLLSAVLLLQTEPECAAQLHTAVAQVCRDAGEPDVRDLDHAGRVHEVWVVGDRSTMATWCELAGGGELVVADGNHRSLAAQTAGLPRFLAVITTPESVELRPYHRLLSTWPADLPALPDALRAVGAEVVRQPGSLTVPVRPGTVHVYVGGYGYAVRLPTPVTLTGVERLDHALLERVLVTQILGWDAGDPRIRYIGGDYPAQWLCAQVDAGLAAAAVLIAPVRVQDFVEVNLDRAKMPRKSTWFVPKARAGLVLADVREQPGGPPMPT